MTDKEAMKLALFALDIVKIHFTQSRHVNEAIVALKERLADPMREVQRLGQEIECPECKAEVLYECVACSSNNYPPKRTEQEPVELPCCGYTDASAVKWNPFNGVVQCHNCGQCYTTPPQRTWVDLSDEDIEECFTVTPDLYLKRHIAQRISDKLKEKNT